MIPDPMHPAVVHIPIALAVVLPVLIFLSIVLIRRGADVKVAWLPVAVLSFILFSGALLAQRTGESEEEAVEQIVPERYIENHEENAEVFTIVAGVLFVLSLGGLVLNKVGNSVRIATAVASLGLLALAFQTGHSGGELVYEHGAASTTSVDGVLNNRTRRSEDDDD